MSNQKKYPTDEFRQEAVRMLESSGKSVPELARTGHQQQEPARLDQTIRRALGRGHSQ